MTKPIRVLAVNAVLVVIALVGSELIFGHWVSHAMSILSQGESKNRFTDRYYETVFTMCPDKYLHHMYCPKISHRKKLSARDGGETIISYVNKSSVRVAGMEDMGTTTNTSDFDIINIGDSLLQADEVLYEKTLSRILESATGKKVLQVGMGGWAPVNFYAWLKLNPLRPGVSVNIFVTPNDILPNDGLSNLNFHRLGTLDKNNNLIFGDSSPVWSIFDEIGFAAHLKHTLQMNSVLYRVFVRVRTHLRKKTPQQNIFSPSIFSDVLTTPVTDCNRMSKYDNIAVKTRDYVRLAFDLNCWDEELREHVDSGIEDLRKATQIVMKRKGTVHIFLAPPVLAFEDEGVNIKTRDKFKMTQNAAITSEPLLRYITAKLADIPVKVVFLEKIIREKKLTEKEKFFFLEDSHWNKRMNRFLGTWMAETFYQ
jgi:hypothetical protein